LAWWALGETSSAEAMGTVLLLSFAPILLFLLAGRVVVDRLPRLRGTFAADLVNGAAVGVPAHLAAIARFEVMHAYAACAVFGMAETFFFPAHNAWIPQIIPAESCPAPSC
jgi:hypothetical protein